MNLLRFAIERTYRGVTPERTITAPHPTTRLRVMTAADFENVARYRIQSENTRDGQVAPLPRKAA